MIGGEVGDIGYVGEFGSTEGIGVDVGFWGKGGIVVIIARDGKVIIGWNFVS